MFNTPWIVPPGEVFFRVVDQTLMLKIAAPALIHAASTTMTPTLPASRFTTGCWGFAFEALGLGPVIVESFSQALNGQA